MGPIAASVPIAACFGLFVGANKLVGGLAWGLYIWLGMKTIISSQRYFDEAIVAAKQESEDYEVQLVTVVVDGAEYAVVVDGHHSLEAARRDGVEPNYVYVGGEIQAEADTMSAENWLLQHHMGDDYFDVATGRAVWQ